MRTYPRRSGELRRHEGGFSVEGPGFYVWDEDPREVSRLARDLARGAGADETAPGPRPDPTDPPDGEA
jgi:hypothetical protein